MDTHNDTMIVVPPKTIPYGQYILVQAWTNIQTTPVSSGLIKIVKKPKSDEPQSISALKKKKKAN